MGGLGNVMDRCESARQIHKSANVEAGEES
jgi:hypothetical protein